MVHQPGSLVGLHGPLRASMRAFMKLFGIQSFISLRASPITKRSETDNRDTSRLPKSACGRQTVSHDWVRWSRVQEGAANTDGMSLGLIDHGQNAHACVAL